MQQYNFEQLLPLNSKQESVIRYGANWQPAPWSYTTPLNYSGIGHKATNKIGTDSSKHMSKGVTIAL